jgi:diguanylate cyclase (GGDEF)-like protein/PAS domain S-box-containing protein
MHRLLLRQIRKAFASPAEIPESVDPLLALVDRAYSQYDDDLDMLHRSLELSSGELVRRNAEMRAVFQAFPDTFLWVDEEGTVLDCRGGSDDVVTLVPGLVRGCRIWELPITCGQEKCAEIFAEFRSDREVRHVEYTVDLDGRELHYEARLLHLVEDVTLVILRNITARKRAELRLEDSRQQLQDIIEFLPDATLAVDADGRVIAWNKAIEIMTGVSKSDMIGKDDHEYALPFYGERRPGLIARVTRDFAGNEADYDTLEQHGETVVGETFVPMLHGGRGAYVRATASPLYDRQGRRSGAIESIRDTTLRRRSERLTTALYRISSEASANSDLDSLFHTIHAVLREFINAPNFFIALVDREHDRLVFPFFSDERDTALSIENISSPDMRSPTLSILRTGKPLHLTGEEIRNRLDSGEMRLFGSMPTDWLGVPLTIREESIGVMAVQRYEELLPFSAEDELFMGMVADNVALAIQRKQAEEALVASEEKYRSIFENASEGIFQSSLDGRMLNANPSFARIFGYSSVEKLLRDVNIRDLYALPENRDRLLQRLRGGETIVAHEGQARRRDGSMIWVSLNIRLVRDDKGEPLYLEGTFEDITARKEYEEQLTHQALHDALTGLPNRTLFIERLDRAIKRSERTESAYSVLLVDLDRFKRVNDSLGHVAGDRLLIEVGRRLGDCVRSMDTVARLGGDEFAIILEEFQTSQEAIQITRRIQEELRKPFLVGGGEVVLSASIGLVLRTEGYEQPEDVLRDADISMYRAKDLGKNRYKIFDKTMHMRAVKAVQMENELRRAIPEREFFVMYQPIHDIQGGLYGFEALVRWNHPERGIIPPNDFIPVAEESGLIIELGIWVLETACDVLARWNRRKTERRLSLSVNLSRRQLSQPKLVHNVAQILRDSMLDPQLLTLEVTETAIMDNPEQALQRLNMLKELGLRLSVDDFGTGYSSLAYLQRFPVDILKVDRAFVDHMAEDQESQEIVRAIIALGHSLRLNLVAEGVETVPQFELLKAMQCDFVQGYLFNKPLSCEDVEKLLDGL